ncbi:transcription elongation factor GreA [Dictyobacter alpinus]|uniref:Transcription elongation factor GreA n=1 Tax=Dictyobacter alpinus TaxID=2014873 RepID=A0A402B357_9CHLR|nr:transcription elongation factor GreA [Dictyobacter alpinus]GCE25763.1 transcription elongation factor GreA [Dictyobacter alpinus]
MSIGGQSDASDRKVYRLTPEGYSRMKERLDYLRDVKRREVADYIHEAKEAGDISESSAYEEAKNDQAMLEGEIAELEKRLNLSEVMTPDMHAGADGIVRIGMQVEVETDRGTKRMFKIVETFEADPKAGLISDQAPVGKALMGHREGDEVSVSTPGGVTTYYILSIRPML